MNLAEAMNLAGLLKGVLDDAGSPERKMLDCAVIATLASKAAQTMSTEKRAEVTEDIQSSLKRMNALVAEGNTIGLFMCAISNTPDENGITLACASNGYTPEMACLVILADRQLEEIKREIVESQMPTDEQKQTEPEPFSVNDTLETMQ